MTTVPALLPSPPRDLLASLVRAPTTLGAPLAPASLERALLASLEKEAPVMMTARVKAVRTPTSTRPTSTTTTTKKARVDLASPARDHMDLASPERDLTEDLTALASPARDLTALVSLARDLTVDGADGEPFVVLTWNKKSVSSDGAAGDMVDPAREASPAQALESPERDHQASLERDHLTHAHVDHLANLVRDHLALANLARDLTPGDHLARASPAREAPASHQRDLLLHQKTPTSSRPTTNTTTMKIAQVDLASPARDHTALASQVRDRTEDHMDQASPARDHTAQASLARDPLVAGVAGGKSVINTVAHQHTHAR